MGLSYQFKNLNRGVSFTKGQFKKWVKEMKHDDMLIIESVAYDELVRLGYEPHLVKSQAGRVVFTEEILQEYDAENKRLVAKMYEDLAVNDPDDLKRRQIQAAVLKTPTSVYYDEEFVKSAYFDIKDDKDLDFADAFAKEKKFHETVVESFDFASWPKGAEQVGFMNEGDVAKRLCFQPTKVVALSENVSVTFAAVSQAGYYPEDRDKKNQDAFIAGEVIANPRVNGEVGVLFACFDGHGPGKSKQCYLHCDIVPLHTFISHAFVLFHVTSWH